MRERSRAGDLPDGLRTKEHWVAHQVLARRAAAHPDRPFVRGSEGSLTYGAADERSGRLAAGFARAGVKQGDHVAVLLPNSLAYVTTWFALSRIGAVHVAVNTGYVGAFLAHVVRDSGARVVVTSSRLVGALTAIAAAIPNVQVVVVVDEPMPAGETAPVPHVARIAFDELASTRGEPPQTETTYRDVNTIMYTSGTTGPSKGVLMPHAHNYLLGLGIVEHLGIRADDVYYISMPLFHANAMFMQLYATLIAGASAVIVPKFSASAWLSDIRAHGCTVTHLIGVMTEFVHRQPETPEDRKHSLRVVLAVPTPPDLAPLFRERFGVVLAEGYGMTEVNMPLYTPVGEPYPPGSCGKPYTRYFDVRIADPETDEDVNTGEIGEILVRPKEPFAFSLGYHALPEKTVEAWRNFWFHTGDAGRRDEAGFFFFVDRIKDCIRRRGENISSFEIEAVLLGHPGVTEAAAVAVPSEIPGGEDEIKACVVVRAGAQASEAELAAHCEGKMPAFAVPRYIEVLDALPRTPTEKIQKAKLRALGITARTWDRSRGGYAVASAAPQEGASREREREDG